MRTASSEEWDQFYGTYDIYVDPYCSHDEYGQNKCGGMSCVWDEECFYYHCDSYSWTCSYDWYYYDDHHYDDNDVTGGVIAMLFVFVILPGLCICGWLCGCMYCAYKGKCCFSAMHSRMVERR